MGKWQKKKKEKDKSDMYERLRRTGDDLPGAPSALPGAAVAVSSSSSSSSSTVRPVPPEEGAVPPGEEEKSPVEEVGGSSSSTSPAANSGGQGKASTTPATSTSDEVYTIGSILPRTGPLLRALTRGGSSAAQATKELHRRWNHLPAREIQALYRKAGLDPALINEIPKILESCKLCRMWDRLPPRQVAASEFAKSFNECLW